MCYNTNVAQVNIAIPWRFLLRRDPKGAACQRRNSSERQTWATQAAPLSL
jgi:hypothetical protein